MVQVCITVIRITMLQFLMGNGKILIYTVVFILYNILQESMAFDTEL